MGLFGGFEKAELFEGQGISFKRDPQGPPLGEPTLQDLFGQRILHVPLDGAAKGSGTEGWIVPAINEEVFRVLIDRKRDLSFAELVLEPIEHEAHDLAEGVLA